LSKGNRDEKPIPWGKLVEVDHDEHERWQKLLFRDPKVTEGAKVCGAHVRTRIHFARGKDGNPARKGYAYEAAKTIGAATGVGERTARRRLEELEGMDYVELEERFVKGATGVRLKWPSLALSIVRQKPTTTPPPRGQARGKRGRFAQASTDTDDRSTGSPRTDGSDRSAKSSNGQPAHRPTDNPRIRERSGLSADSYEDSFEDSSARPRLPERVKPDDFTDDEWIAHEAGDIRQKMAVLHQVIARRSG
jgi:hypothetical protein